MKRTAFSIAALCLILSLSCSKMQDIEAGLVPEETELTQGEDIRSITFKAPAPSETDEYTRAMLVNDGKNFVWEVTDTVGIYPDKGSQVFFSMADGAGTSTSVFDGGGWALKSSATYYSYYPFIGDIYLNKEKMPVYFEGQYQIGTDNFDNIRDYLYMCATGTVSGNNLSFSYKHLCSFIYVKLTAPLGQYDRLSLSIDESLFTTHGYYALNSESPAIEGTRFSDIMSVELKDFIVGSESRQYLVNFLVAPVDLTGKEVVVTLSSVDGKKYVYKKKPSKAYLAGMRYGLSCTDYEIVEQVDNVDNLQSAIDSGGSNIEVLNVPSGDVDLDLSSADGDLSIDFPIEEAEVNIGLSYPESASKYPTKIQISAPLSSSLVLDTPKSTVTVNGAGIESISARTAESTLIIKSNVNAGVVYLKKGSIINNGTIEHLDFSSLEEDVTLLNYGTILRMTGVDNTMTTTRGYHVDLYEAAGSSIGESRENVKINVSGEMEGLNAGNLYVVSVYSSDATRQWTKYAHGVFNDPSMMKVKLNPDMQYKIDLQIVENGSDSLYHFNPLYNGSNGFPMYYKLGRMNNRFTYHASDTSEDDFYGVEDSGITYFSSNSSSRNSRLKIYRGSVVCSSDLLNGAVSIPVYYARIGVRIFVKGLTHEESKIQCTLTLASTFSATMDMNNSYFGFERSMSNLGSMMSSIYSGLEAYENATLSVKYSYSFDGVKGEKYLIKDQRYSLPRYQNTIFTITVDDSYSGTFSSNSGFLISMDSSNLSDGENYFFNGTIKE